MISKSAIEKTELAMAAFAAVAMVVLSLIFHPVQINPVQYGLCLPSPDSWGFQSVWSWGVNTFLIALITLLLFLVNRSYNFVRTTEPTMAALLLVMTCSGPWFTQEINTSVLLCLANVVCLGIIFDSYDSPNATREMFILGVVAGMGSMVQYAFLPMAFVYIVWALFMKILRIKETLALVAGLLCPYWIGLGVGWIEISQLHFPSINPLFSEANNPSDFFLLLASIAFAAVVGFVVTVINTMKLYAGNSRVNAMNLCISTLGAASVICILVDYDNMVAYIVTLFMACSVQLANICALWHPRLPWLVTAIPSLFYLGVFVCSLVL